MVESHLDVLAIGEVMGLLDPETSGPLEDVTRFNLRIAGAEGNVLITLARLGHATALVSAVGADPLGRLVTRTLADQGVNTEHVHVDPLAPTGVFFKECLDDGARRVYYYRSGSAASRLRFDFSDLEQVGAPRILTLSGVTLGLGGETGLAMVARNALCWAASHDCTVVFDPNLRQTLWDGPRAVNDFAEVLPYIDVLLAGREELATLMPSSDPDEAARDLCRAGMSAVVLKDGAKGACVYEMSRVTDIAPYPIDVVVDPVGAGDAFAAGVISGLLNGWPIGDGARIGAVLGARAVTMSGDWESASTGEDPRRVLEQYTSALSLVEEQA